MLRNPSVLLRFEEKFIDVSSDIIVRNPRVSNVSDSVVNCEKKNKN